jgi:hypothetical protein
MYLERVFDMFSVDFSVLMASLGLQEMVMAIWLIVKGFHPFAIASGFAKVDMNRGNIK